jgi:hypothetical protein
MTELGGANGLNLLSVSWHLRPHPRCDLQATAHHLSNLPREILEATQAINKQAQRAKLGSKAPCGAKCEKRRSDRKDHAYKWIIDHVACLFEHIGVACP